MASREFQPHASERPLATIDGTHPFRSLFRLLWMHSGRLIILTVAFAVKNSPAWVVPVLTAAIIDTVVEDRPVGELWLYGLVAAIVLLQNYPVGIYYNDQSSRVFRQVGADLRNALASRLQNLSIGFHTRASASVIQTKLVRDVEVVEQMLRQVYPSTMSALFLLVGALAVTAAQIPAFILIFAVTIPLGVSLLILVRKRSQQRNEEFRREVEQFSARVGEMATLMPITRAHGLEAHAASRVADSAEDVRLAGFSLDQVTGRFGAASWLSFQLLSMICLFAAAAASLSGILDITPGQVVLLSTYFTILTTAIVQLMNLMPVLTQGRESLRSIAEVLQDPDIEENYGKRRLNGVEGKIGFRDVTFSYPGDRRRALDSVELVIHPGQTVAFVGPSGSGKSTLLNLVLGFLRPDRGQILLDDKDMQYLDLRSFRQFVSVVPQDPVLFEGSIRENITYGLGHVDDDRVSQALRDANALEIVEQLPDGWDTVVGERGARLSGGQRQRFAIARALVRNPKVLLLDEATSALDSESEAKVKEALSRLMRGRTTLVVAHRLSTIRSADRIVVLDHGRIVEAGTHTNLIDLDAVYARLNRKQTV
jgi:ATP-binding cassette subfamily B protein